MSSMIQLLFLTFKGEDDIQKDNICHVEEAEGIIPNPEAQVRK